MIHGGDIYRNEVELDFSVNINPLGIPDKVRQALIEAVGTCTRYPDIEVQRLTEAVSNMLGIPENTILFGNGASELFLAVMHTLRPEKVWIPVPSFYGYEYVAENADCKIQYFYTKEEQEFTLDETVINEIPSDTDMVFLANPNNPTGMLLRQEVLVRILDYCKEQNIYVVLDECFIEFCEEAYSMLSEVNQYENLMIVRAFTKIFAIPGVRLGYLVSSNEELMRKIKRHLPEWNISAFAEAAGTACAEETAFIEQTRTYVAAEREFVVNGLAKMGLTVYPGSANFLMIKTELPLYEELLKRKILIRDCSNYKGLVKGFYRIAVKTRAENERLLEKIGEIKCLI